MQQIDCSQSQSNEVDRIDDSAMKSSETIDPIIANDENEQLDEAQRSDLGLEELPHLTPRTKAAKVYLRRSLKQRNAHRTRLQTLREKSQVGDFVGLRIDKVDRTNTDPKILPCVIVEERDGRVKVACVNGIIDQWWPLDVLVGLSAVSDELVNLVISGLPEISMITASKLYVRGAINGVCCSCKGGCKTKQCTCKRNQVFCSTKCHKNTACCSNIEK